MMGSACSSYPTFYSPHFAPYCVTAKEVFLSFYLISYFNVEIFDQFLTVINKPLIVSAFCQRRG